MGTIVTIDVPGHAAPDRSASERDASIERACGWFRHVESICSRFDPTSELSVLSQSCRTPIVVSPLLFDALRFALAVAAETAGAFDPTVGHRMAAAGFNREHRTGRVAPPTIAAEDDVSFRDVDLDQSTRTVTLRRPMLLDLGGVAKGLALDLAARELAPLEHFAIDAGGDLYLAGHNPRGEPWSVGVRHPSQDDRLLDSIQASNEAVCTSGNYEWRGATNTDAPHLLDPRSGAPCRTLASATVVAPAAMLADALATAAFVLGPDDGLALLRRHGARGVLFTTELQRWATEG